MRFNHHGLCFRFKCLENCRTVFVLKMGRQTTRKALFAQSDIGAIHIFAVLPGPPSSLLGRGRQTPAKLKLTGRHLKIFLSANPEIPHGYQGIAAI